MNRVDSADMIRETSLQENRWEDLRAARDQYIARYDFDKNTPDAIQKLAVEDMKAVSVKLANLSLSWETMQRLAHSWQNLSVSSSSSSVSSVSFAARKQFLELLGKILENGLDMQAQIKAVNHAFEYSDGRISGDSNLNIEHRSHQN